MGNPKEVIIKLFTEWKKILDQNVTNQADKKKAKLSINKAIRELKKPLKTRDCKTIMLIMYDLQSVKGLSKYVSQSMGTMRKFVTASNRTKNGKSSIGVYCG